MSRAVDLLLENFILLVVFYVYEVVPIEFLVQLINLHELRNFGRIFMMESLMSDVSKPLANL